MSILLLLLMVRSLSAAIHEVCAACSPHATVQSAVDGAASGDIIEIKSGEVFNENVVVRGKKRLTLRSSRWRELPPTGYRIDPTAHSTLLPTIRTTNTNPALRIGRVSDDAYVVENGIDTTNNTITFAASNTFANGDVVSCDQTLAVVSPQVSVMPTPLQRGVKYFVRDWSGATGKLAATPGGAAIDLTGIGNSDAPSGGGGGDINYYRRPFCQLWHETRDITVQGIRLLHEAASSNQAMAHIGGGEPVLQQGPTNIRFLHTVITGLESDQNGPVVCLAINGGQNILVRDSWIDHCKQQGNEGKGIAIGNSSDVQIENTFIAGASINVLTGGGQYPNNSVMKRLTMRGNRIEKRGYMHWRSGSAIPTGTAYPGAFYRRTGLVPDTCANGACYIGQPNGTWAMDTGATLRTTHYAAKNLLELKDCEDCFVEGNYFKFAPESYDSGQGWCFGISTLRNATQGGSTAAYAHNIKFKNNYALDCVKGIALFGSVAEGFTFDRVPKSQIEIVNNVIHGIADLPRLGYTSDDPTDDNFWVMKGVSGMYGLTVDALTARGSPRWGLAFDDAPGWSDQQMRGVIWKNSLIPGSSDFGTFFHSGGLNSCGTGSDGWQGIGYGGPTPHVMFSHLVWYQVATGSLFLNSANCASWKSNVTYSTADPQFISASNSRLAGASPYIAAADHGGPLGADIDMIEQYTNPARDGQPNYARQLFLRPKRLSATRADFDFLSRGLSCTVNLWAGERGPYSGTADFTATDTDGAFSFTGLTSGARYRYEIDCRSSLGLYWRDVI